MGIDQILAIRVDRADAKPLYAQIAERVRAFLREGAIKPGTTLPPERVLYEHYGVHRLTLRQAFAILEQEGLIKRQRGRGTVVTPCRVQKAPQELRSFTEDMTARGSVASSRLLSFRLTTPGVAVREFLQLPEHERVFEINRMRLKDGLPLALEKVQIPQYLCPNLDQFNLATDSIYRILEEEFGVHLGRGIEEISAVRPTRVQRQLLNLPRSTVILQISRRTYTTNDTPLEVTTSAYRGDLYTAVVQSVRAEKR
jgi:GntR family transcriptional regulator